MARRKKEEGPAQAGADPHSRRKVPATMFLNKITPFIGLGNSLLNGRPH
jgi:hypothetical protein